MGLKAVQTKTLTCQQGAVRAVRFNVDGDYAITCGSDKSIKLWNPRKPLLLKTYSGHGYEVMDARGSCDSSTIASGGMDKCVFLWDVSSGQVLRRYRAHASYVNCIQFNEESTIILSGSVDCSVKSWDCKSRSKEPVQVFDESKDSITSIAVSDHEIITGSLDGKVRRYDLRKGQLHVDDLSSPVNHVNFTKDGQCILASCGNGVIKLLDKESGEILSEGYESKLVLLCLYARKKSTQQQQELKSLFEDVPATQSLLQHTTTIVSSIVRKPIQEATYQVERKPGNPN